MKQIIFLSLLFFHFPNLNSQDYVPMAVDSATWYMASTDEFPLYDEFVVLRIEGDTMINNLKYSKIYHYDVFDNEVSVSSRKLLGLLRDDINERKVYGGLLGGVQYGFETFLNVDSRCDWGDLNTFNEHLLYDFSLQEGDTINNCMLTIPTIISLVETIDRFGYQRRSLLLTDDGQYTMMTEGIGTCIGIFKGENCYFTGGGYSFALYNYCIGSFSNCNILTSTAELKFINQIDISPNPVTSDLFITSSVTLKKLSLFDMRGNLIESFENTNQINMINFHSGIYILKIEDDSGHSCSKKVVKN